MKIILSITFVGLFVGALSLTAPSEQDIQKCVESGVYTYERCVHELSR